MQIQPYGDHIGDGIVQVSFTVPLEAGPVAREAAVCLCRTMNLCDPNVATEQALGPGFTFFVIYARMNRSVSIADALISAPEPAEPNIGELETILRQTLQEKIVVIGATTGTDAHTVGLDSILNRKGFHGHRGLESYDLFEIHNLGSQIANQDLISYAYKHRASVILVSQVITQRDIHLNNLTELTDLLDADNQRGKFLLIAGGPRLTHKLAIELGYDAGFGADTIPSQVAAFIMTEMIHRNRFQR